MTDEERAAAHREMADAILGSIDALIELVSTSTKAQTVFRVDPVGALRSMAIVLRARHVDGVTSAEELVNRAVPK